MRVGLGLGLLVSGVVVVFRCSMLVFHGFVLFGFFLEDVRRAEAASSREVTDIADHLPHLIVFQNAFPSRHSGRPNPIFDNPLQLAVGIFLNVLGGKIGNGRFHFLGEWHSGVLSVQSMANLAVMLEMLGPFLD